jgi:hypothetical protein
MLLSALASFNYFHLQRILPGVQSNHVQEMFRLFTMSPPGKNIVVNWGTTSTAGVHHFVVYHSEVGDFFDPIEEVYPDGTLKYSYKHESVFWDIITIISRQL